MPYWWNACVWKQLNSWHGSKKIIRYAFNEEYSQIILIFIHIYGILASVKNS